MITEIKIQNCLSIRQATIKLQPFTLLIGANGSGKTNFLKVLSSIDDFAKSEEQKLSLMKVVWKERGDGWFERDMTVAKIKKHVNHIDSPQTVSFRTDTDPMKRPLQIGFFTIKPDAIGMKESIAITPHVQCGGKGAVQVLDSLKTGDREDLFQKIEGCFRHYIPEVEKLSFVPLDNGKKLQVRERHVNKPIALSELSEGTRLVLTILTIIYQENPPNIICLEDIDRALHPDLFQKLVELCIQTTRERDIQIIATTHNPYLINKFYGYEEAVIIVEKENGETKFATLAERIEGLELEAGDPLGSLWASGFVGGMPNKREYAR